MANEVRIGIDVKGEQVAKQKLGVVEKAAEKAGDAIEDMGGQAVVAGKATDKVADDFKGAADEAGHLQREVDELTQSYKELLGQFNQTGDQSLKKDIGAARRKLNAAKRNLRDALPDPADVAEAGTSIGTELVASIAEAAKAGGPYVTAALAALAVASVPGIAAVVSGAVLGGIGAGGIVGGVALAAQDPRVEAAAADVGRTISGEFRNAAGSFVDPVIKSLEKAAGANWAAKLEPSFDRLSRKVDPLADGLIGLADNALPGFIDALEASEPSLDTLSKKLPDIGAAIGDFLSTVSENPEEAALALELLLSTLEGTIQTAGELIGVLTEVYGAAATVADAIGVMPDRMHAWKKATDDGAGSTRNYANAADEAKVALDQLGKEIDEHLGKTFSLEEMQDHAAQGFANLAEQIDRQREAGDKGAGSLEGQTEAARANREQLRNLLNTYGDMIAKAATTGQSTEGLRAEFIKAATQAGLNKEQVKRYADELARLIRLQRQFQGGIDSGGMGGAVFSQRASGGPVRPGEPYLVGEEGPELVTFGQNGMVHNAGQTAAMMSGPSVGSVAGGGAMQVAVTVVGGDALTRAVAESLRFEIRTTANGDPTEYFS